MADLRERGGARAAAAAAARGRHGVGGDTREAAVERARREREERARTRQLEGAVVDLQRRARGAVTRRRAWRAERQDFDKKLSDIQKLVRMLASKNVAFQLPEPTATRLVRQFLFFRGKGLTATGSAPGSAGDDDERLASLASAVLLPGLRAAPGTPTSLLCPAALAVSAVGSSAGRGAGGCNGDAAAKATARGHLQRLQRLAVACLEASCDAAPERGCAMLETACLLVAEPSVGSSTAHSATSSEKKATSVALADLCTTLLSHIVEDGLLYRCARRRLLRQGTPEKGKLSDENKGAQSPLMSLLLWPMRAAAASLAPSPHQQKYLALAAARHWFAHILTIPLLTLRVTEATLEDIASQACWSVSLRVYLQEDFELPRVPSECDVCNSETWLMGNLAVLSLHGDAWAAAQSDTALTKAQAQVFARLLERVPLGAFDDRSEVTWHSHGSSGVQRAVVIPEALRDQLRLFVCEPRIRSMARCALKGLPEHKLSCGMTDAEVTEERELIAKGLGSRDVAGDFAAVNAAAAQMTEKSVKRKSSKRWLGAQWARKLRGAMDSVLPPSTAAAASSSSSSSAPAPAAAATSKSSSKPSVSKAMRSILRFRQTLGYNTSGSDDKAQLLENTTSMARLAATGQAPSQPSEAGMENESEEDEDDGADDGYAHPVKEDVDGDAAPVDSAAVSAFCRLYCVFLMRWPATSVHSSGKGLLDTLTFSTGTVARLWLFLQTSIDPSLEALARQAQPALSECSGVCAVLALFAICYCHLLSILDEFEMYDDQKPLPLFQLRRMVRALKVLLFRGFWGPTQLPLATSATPAGAMHSGTSSGDAAFPQFLMASVSRAMRALYSRSSRRPICLPDVWLVGELEGLSTSHEFVEQTPSAKRLLAAMPYALPFADRMRLFQRLVAQLRRACQPEGARPLRLDIRRGFVLEDGFHQLMRARPTELRTRLAVVYTDAHGMREAGVDMGGLFKDFWTDLSAQAFNPGYGLFSHTLERLQYPNPSASLVHGDQCLEQFAFMGRLVGKALFENITVQPKFAHFFLSKLLGHFNTLNDLPSLDEDLYKNLMFLKNYDGDVADLCLTFTISDTAYGAQREVPLVHGGADIPVTNRTRLRYIHTVADYRLNKQVKAQSDAFLRGLLDIIPAQWLQMFNEPELQVIISGSVAPIDVDDLRRHTRLAGGFLSADRHVDRFFQCMREFDGTERAQLLAFVTGCSRPPSLGFEALEPPFTLQRISITADDERLPTASTCFNLLKLPAYSSKNIMKSKLLMAIQSGAGFDLS